MNAEELQFGLTTVLSVVFGSGGALAVWFTMKGRIQLLEQAVKNSEDDNKMAHERITNLKEKVDLIEKFAPEIKLEMKEMELRILSAIHKLDKR